MTAADVTGADVTAAAPAAAESTGLASQTTPPRDPAPAPDPTGTPALTPGALEAVLLVADEPVPVAVLAEVFAATHDEVAEQLELLAAEHDRRAAGIELRGTEAGWRLHTRPGHVEAVERFLREGQRVRLTRAGLETLAVVAYAQPATRAHVSSVRGVASDGVLRTLVARGLVEEAGTDAASGAGTYRTTPLFLERLGVTSLAELPALAPHLPDLDEESAGTPADPSTGDGAAREDGWR